MSRLVSSLLRAPLLASVLLGSASALNLSASAFDEDSSLSARNPSTDPRDFSWIKTWAAVGDSFTAGIGSGMIWSDSDNSYSCSRYDLSYVAILNNYFGSSVQTFNNIACSGATSSDVYNQINTLPATSQDLIVLTAGGNDLCLTSIIQYCILKSQTTAAACQNAQTTAQNFIDNTLANNLAEVVDNAVSKLNNNGILVFTQYAQFFNDVADAPCHFDEDWVFPGTAGSGSLLLTTTLRSQLNQLVVNTNNVILQVVASAQAKYKNDNIQITTADWDDWLNVVGGHFCEPGEKPDPNDPANANCQFFKLDTTKQAPISSKKMLRDVTFGAMDNETAVTAQALDVEDESPGFPEMSLEIRDPVAPSCSGGSFGNLLPDSIGKIFHPNELGHLTIASFVGDAISVARAKIIGAPNPDCTDTNSLTCAQTGGSKNYASPYSLYAQTQNFCKSVVAQIPPNTQNWQFSDSYYGGTPDASTWSVQLVGGAISVTYDECQTAVNNILDGCDGNDPNNPMNWKFGGKLETGDATWTITPTKTGRVFPPYKEPVASCYAWYHVFWDSWNIYGGGFSDWDWGQKTILGNFSSCIGSTPTRWRFTYYDQPDSNGYEWEAKGNAPIWIKNRCMGGVINAAGGPSGQHCTGNG